jgi:hypothetical protein
MYNWQAASASFNIGVFGIVGITLILIVAAAYLEMWGDK